MTIAALRGQGGRRATIATSTSALVAAALLAACGHPAPAPGAVEQRGSGPAAPPAVVAAPVGVSDAPLCAGPGELIGVCAISADGVMLQARNLRPGARAIVQLDGDYASPPLGCRKRWHQDLVVDAGGVVTARFDIPATDRCKLLASMIVHVYVEPDGPDLGPRRFSTMPPP